MINRWYKSDLNLPATYKHNNEDLENVVIIDYDGKGHAWVKWLKDDFVNMVDCNRLDIIKEE
jgi:hypothetical protein